MSACINCGKEVAGKFCDDCGQRVNVKRLTWREVWDDFWSKVYGFDGMLPRTLRDLTLHPGRVARAYIAGNRMMYYGPIGYFFLMITLMFVVMSTMNIDVTEFMTESGRYGLKTTPKPGSGQEKLTASIMKVVSDNLRLFSFAVIPVQGLCSRYFFFRKSGLNYLEHTVLPFYVQGHVYWLTILSVVYYKVSDSPFLSWLVAIFMLAYFGFSYTNFFSSQSKIKAALKGLGVYFLSQFFYLLIMLAVILVVMFTNPEVMEMIRPSNNR